MSTIEEIGGMMIEETSCYGLVSWDGENRMRSLVSDVRGGLNTALPVEASRTFFWLDLRAQP